MSYFSFDKDLTIMRQKALKPVTKDDVEVRQISNLISKVMRVDVLSRPSFRFDSPLVAVHNFKWRTEKLF